MPAGRGELAGEDLAHRLEAREAIAYDRLMRHCDHCGRCHLARTTGRLLEQRALCSCGRLLAGAWDAAEAAIADALLVIAA
ncbi:MAG TPA: hypothetical protein VGE42_10815 [Candidatus Dormibacteraeota bacterium]